jgi:hypothetical protein
VIDKRDVVLVVAEEHQRRAAEFCRLHRGDLATSETMDDLAAEFERVARAAADPMHPFTSVLRRPVRERYPYPSGRPTMSHDDKTEAQSRLSALCEAADVLAGHVYTHYAAGGEYVVFAVALDEATLEPRVGYYSLTYRTRWSRTLAVFAQTVEVSGVRVARRFTRVRPATLEEFLAAIDVKLTVAPGGDSSPVLTTTVAPMEAE